MAVGQESGKKRYLTIKEGKLQEKQGEQILEYGFVEGHLMNISFHDHAEYGKQMHLHIIDEQDYFVLQMYMNSYPAKAFLMMLKNVDLQDAVKIIVKLTVENNQKRVSLFVQQDGLACKWYYNKDNQRDLPGLVPIKTRDKKGQLVDGWDDTDRMNFLIKMVNGEIVPALQRKLSPYPNHPSYRTNVAPHQIAGNHFGSEQRHNVPNNGGQQINAADLTEPIDDLPF